MDKIHGEKARKGVSKLGIALLMLTIIVLFTTLGAAFIRANKHIQFELPVPFLYQYPDSTGKQCFPSSCLDG